MILLLASAVGIALYAWPFVASQTPGSLIFGIFSIGAIIAVVSVEMMARNLDNRRLALLIAICTLDSALRSLMVTGIGGFSPIYLLILCAGYVFGPGYGFICGGMTLLVSGALTGGIGPWIPYEFFATAWVGLAAGLAGLPRRSRARFTWMDMGLLLLVGIVFGYLCGALADIFDWTTYWRAVPGLGWYPGAALPRNAGNFLHFYLATSLAWDQLRAAGNVILLLLLARPVINAMQRIRQRTAFQIEPIPASTALPV